MQSRYQVMKDVLFPGAMPHIATELAAEHWIAWRAVIAGEMLPEGKGLAG